TRFSRDWSSDVCSSDLAGCRAHGCVLRPQRKQHIDRVDGNEHQTRDQRAREKVPDRYRLGCKVSGLLLSFEIGIADLVAEQNEKDRKSVVQGKSVAPAG